MCDVRLESIDDLLSRAASVVLTLAYTRAIRTLGAAACEAGFVFLVADYVVADGALRYVLGRLAGGVDAVLAGNFQIVQEAMGPLLAQARAQDGVALCVPPRALVRLALDWLHPATNACMAGNSTLHDPQANRVFWRVGPDTVLGHFYLMHMVAIRPQTVDVIIAGPCDYTFVPEFCPNGCVETNDASAVHLAIDSYTPPTGSGLSAGTLSNCEANLGQGETSFTDCSLNTPGTYTLVATDPTDRRSRQLILTPLGRDLLAGAVPIWQREHAAIDAEFGVGGIDRLRADLRALL